MTGLIALDSVFLAQKQPGGSLRTSWLHDRMRLYGRYSRFRPRRGNRQIVQIIRIVSSFSNQRRHRKKLSNRCHALRAAKFASYVRLDCVSPRAHYLFLRISFIRCIYVPAVILVHRSLIGRTAYPGLKSSRVMLQACIHWS
jgi:hypothetical protein